MNTNNLPPLTDSNKVNIKIVKVSDSDNNNRDNKVTHHMDDVYNPASTVRASLTAIHYGQVTHNPMNHSEYDDDSDYEADVMLDEPALEEPPMYAVVMFNDDYTPMEFVVYVLIDEFRHNEEQAVQIMLSIHNKGKGIAGIYTKDIAETKANKVNTLAKREGFPLMTAIEPSK